jgi:hypothetical protein
MRAPIILKRAYQAATTSLRRYSGHGREVAGKRARVDGLLDAISRENAGAPGEASAYGTVLVDGTFDNPNYWVRYALLRRALGLASAREVGLLGRWRRPEVLGTFARLGIAEHVDFAAPPESMREAKAEAEQLLRATRGPDDIFAWELPGKVHPAIAYDGILKRQRLASVSTNDPRFPAAVQEVVSTLRRAAEILDAVKPELVVISHCFDFSYGGLAWQALSRGIPVILPFGLFGVLRFAMLKKPEDVFAFYDQPSRADTDALAPEKAEAFRRIGRLYLDGRLGGRADDLASVLAFQKNSAHIDRPGLCSRQGWDPEKPIVAFYASNWFDWPHQLGMTQFRDFLDWTTATFEAARANTAVNWLFKPHPAEDWFGGIGLTSILAGLGAPSNIAIAGKTWNNAAVMRSVDAMVTYHGTAGIEFAALGKPVLVPDRGKYDAAGFVKVAESRQNYLDLLGQPWWQGMDLEDARRRAEIFAGWWFCAPDWQEGLILQDDSRQDELYDSIPTILEDHVDTLERECREIREWWRSGSLHYHTAKMLNARSYRLTNLA